MIMTIFLLFTSLALILTVVGYYINENLLIIFGLLIFGLMALPLLNQNLEYKVGTNSTINYSYDNSSNLLSTFDATRYVYHTYTDTIWYGLFFLFISLGGLFGGWYYSRSYNEEDD